MQDTVVRTTETEPTPPPPRVGHDPRAWRLNVLGPVELCYDDRPVDVSGLARDLLALLARTPGQEVSAASIVANLWGTQPPEDAQNVVASQVSRLRKALTVVAPDVDPTGVIVTTPIGYILHIGASNVDAESFERLLADGRRALAVGQPAIAQARLEAGLRLWRGAAYSDFGDQPFTRAEAQRLEDLRLAAIESTVEAQLALAAPGVPPGLLDELQRLLTEHWHRERLWAHLVTALYRLGRRHDALAALREAEARLIEDLTIDPGPELRFAEQAVLSNDPALAGVALRPTTPPAALAMTAPACVGREQEVEWLMAALEMAATRRAQARLIVGSPGIGKTRLAAELAQRVAGRGVAIRYGNGDPDAPAPLLDALIVEHDRLNLIILDDLDLAPTEEVLEVVRFIRSHVDRPLLTLPTCRDPVRVGELAGLPKLVMTSLAEPAIAEIVRVYAPATTDAAAVAAMVNANGVPARLHRSASEWAFARAGRRIDRAVAAVGEPTRWLANTREEVIAGVLELDHVRRRARPLRPAARPIAGSPYRGLARYEPDDAELFRGRERAVAEVIARLVDPPLLAIVGEAGSGKSSLVRAGVLPAVASGVLPESGRWRQLLVTPAVAGELALRLSEPDELPEPAPVAPELTSLADEVADFDGSGDSEADDTTVDSGGWTDDPVEESPSETAQSPDLPVRTLLVVDQFEQAFTLVPAARAELFATLTEAVASGAVTVLLVMRSDAFARCAEQPELARMITANTLFLTPMTADERRRAIEEPAALGGARVEPELVEALIDDAEAAGLPALSAALTTLWTHRADGVLRLSAYRALGGLDRAVEQVGERAYATMTPPQRAVAADLLVDLTSDARPSWREVEAGDATRASTLALLREYGVVSIVDGRVELVHEVLAERWSRLRGWRAERQAQRELRSHLSASTRDWLDRGQEPDVLYAGARLAAAVDYAQAYQVSGAEQEFLNAGQQVLFADEARRRQQLSRLRYVIIALALTLITAVAAGVMVFLAWQDASAANHQADAVRLAQRGPVEPDLRFGLRLAATAATLDGSATTTQALRATLLRSPDLIATAGDGVLAVAVSSDGGQVATGSASGSVVVYRASDLRPTAHLTYPGSAAGLSFGPDGRMLVGWGSAGIVVLTPAGGPPFGGAVTGPGVVLPDGDTVLLAPPGAAPTAWSLSARTPSTTYALPGGAVTGGLVASPDGGAVAFGPAVVSFPSGQTSTVPASGQALALSPGGHTLLVAESNAVGVWDVASGTRTGEIKPAGGAVTAAWSADGSLVATGGADGTIAVYDAKTLELRHTLVGDRRPVRTIHFGLDRATLWTAGDSGPLMAWDLTGSRGVGPIASSTTDTSALVALACRLAGRDLTPSEWATAVPGFTYRPVCPDVR